MNPGDPVRYYMDYHVDRKTGRATHSYFRVGRYVRTIEKGPKKGRIVVEHGGKIHPAKREIIHPEQVVR